MSSVRPRLLVPILVVAAAFAAAPRAAATTLQEIGHFSGSFTDPVYVTSLPDPDMLLVVERRGTIQLWDGTGAGPFLDIRHLVKLADPEQGMFSAAVAPDYSTTGHIYVFYTDQNNDLQIDEYTASGSSAPAWTRRGVLTIPQPTSPVHNGGQLQFGPDGYLYIGTGDGDIDGTLDVDAQNTGSLLGKILRIDPRPAGAAQYSVPPGNPFGNEVWSYGLRNPWRFSFDAATGDLLIGDVGETLREEVNYAPWAAGGGRGLNFGWNCREGTIAFLGCSPPPEVTFTEPIFEYSHDADQVCNAITGGYVVRDPNLTGLYGRYLYADLCRGEIRSVAVPSGTGDRSEALLVAFPQSFGQDSCGRVYVASSEGSVYRFVGDTPAECEPPAAPPIAASCAGQPATRLLAANGSVTGTRVRDVLVGDGRPNRIRTKGGNDLICAAGGNDRIHTGAGNDLVHAGRGRDTIRGGPGNDHCSGGPGKDTQRSC
jgi:hypothetical protein